MNLETLFLYSQRYISRFLTFENKTDSELISKNLDHNKTKLSPLTPSDVGSIMDACFFKFEKLHLKNSISLKPFESIGEI